MSTPRRRFGTDQKAIILKRYLVDKVPISDLCDEYGIKPNQIYAWQKILFDHAETAFQQAGGRPASKVSAQEDKIARLEHKLQQKNEVISELMEENVCAKKSIWGTLNGRWVPHDTRDEVVDYVPLLERADGDPRRPVHRLVGHHAQQVPRLAAALRQGQRAQRLDSARLVAGGRGEAGDPSLLLRVSAGGLPAAGVHDARPRRGGCQPVECLPRVEGGGPHRPLDEQAVEERHGLSSARRNPMNTGISTSATSTFTARFTTSRRSSTATAATSCIGRFAAR